MSATERRGRTDNADEMSARASDGDAGQGTTDQKRDRARTAEQRVKGENRRFCKKNRGRGRALSLIFWKIGGAGGSDGKLVWLFSFLTEGILPPIARKRTLAAHPRPSCPGPE